MHQIAVHVGMTPYRPNSIDGGEPPWSRPPTRAGTCR
jgi:hypothetical protein